MSAASENRASSRLLGWLAAALAIAAVAAAITGMARDIGSLGLIAAAIAAVDGVDVLLVGGSDLSATMGMPGEFARAEFKEALRTVFDAAKAAGKSAGLGGVYNEALMQEFIGLGARFVLGGADMSFILAGGTARAKFINGLR